MADILDDETKRKAREPESWDPGEYQELLSTVIQECEENLDHLARHLLKLEKSPDRETIDSLFRAAHNLKGLSKVIVIDKLNLIAREMENLLESIRQGQRQATSDLIDVLLEATDVVRSNILPSLTDLRPITADITPILEKLVVQRMAGPAPLPRQPHAPPKRAPLPAHAPAGPAPPASSAATSFAAPVAAALPGVPVAGPVPPYVSAPAPAHGVAFPRPAASAAAAAPPHPLSLPPVGPAPASHPSPAPEPPAEPRAVEVPEALAAAAQGARRGPPPPQVAATTADAGDSSGRGAAPDQGLRVGLSKLDKVMDLVGELVIGNIRFEQHLANLRSLGSEFRRCRRRLRGALQTRPIAEFLRSLTVDMDRLLWQASLEAQQPRRLDSVREGFGALVASYQKRGDDGAEGRRSSLDVLVDELDRIERVYDELLKEILESTDQLGLLTNDLQENVMKIRMVPVAQVFNKFPRMVREISRGLGKKVNLSMAGEGTELDKMLVEQIGEPLMHIIRNAIDHGIEGPQARAELGKPEEGSLTLRAYHKGSQIYIEVADDGRGIDPALLRVSAVQKGFFTEAEVAHLTDGQVMDLIFFPGFSTAREITDMSGRGVGLDVVKQSVANMKGSITVESTPGWGTLFQVRLPLTLAIIDVILVTKNNELYAVPLTSIQEMLTIRPTDIRRIGTREMISLHGQTIPILRLDEVLGLEGTSWEEQELLPCLVLGSGDKRACLVVDRMLDKQAIVIKSLGAILNKVRFALGSTILGNGRVILILDPQELIESTSAAIPGQFLARARELQKEVSAAPEAPKAVSILLVEDTRSIRMKMREYLLSAGYRVVEAPDGQAGLETAQREVFDLVSTDIMMPRMDGYELTRNLRRLPEYRSVPIIMVTTKGEKMDKIRGFDAGADDYLTKPFDKETLLQVVRNNVRGRTGG
ncbi:MAG: response regulator [Planctomycetes bacterium]|nr:response regulator [Planctomycetota bacterium]